MEEHRTPTRSLYRNLLRLTLVQMPQSSYPPNSIKSSSIISEELGSSSKAVVSSYMKEESELMELPALREYLKKIWRKKRSLTSIPLTTRFLEEQYGILDDLRSFRQVTQSLLSSSSSTGISNGSTKSLSQPSETHTASLDSLDTSMVGHEDVLDGSHIPPHYIQTSIPRSNPDLPNTNNSPHLVEISARPNEPHPPETYSKPNYHPLSETSTKPNDISPLDSIAHSKILSLEKHLNNRNQRILSYSPPSTSSQIRLSGYLRPTSFNPPIPRLKPQPIKITMMIKRRIMVRERRIARRRLWGEWAGDIKMEVDFWRRMGIVESKKIYHVFDTKDERGLGGIKGNWTIEEKERNDSMDALKRDEKDIKRLSGGWDLEMNRFLSMMDQQFDNEVRRAKMIFKEGVVRRVEKARTRRRQRRRERNLSDVDG
ncbi:hypothetical protein TREMEDRAFT_64146 [Tremella mesenterica DSM 1558]|nr:uncharacterized protein TREMEDRAFT_64146 [Tremella mesenterica DSM 1558]EIW67557.1 hypothetical protein TREMEDRAFT_64146 [Tremella mesenterica DSM 1558]